MTYRIEYYPEFYLPGKRPAPQPQRPYNHIDGGMRSAGLLYGLGCSRHGDCFTCEQEDCLFDTGLPADQKFMRHLLLPQPQCPSPP